jgi:ABC-type lipoprotein release transport system permease subunit
MNTTQTFTTSRQQATSAALALGITLGMLFSINVLAMQPGAEAQMAAQAAANAKMACVGARAQQS